MNEVRRICGRMDDLYSSLFLGVLSPHSLLTTPELYREYTLSSLVGSRVKRLVVRKESSNWTDLRCS